MQQILPQDSNFLDKTTPKVNLLTRLTLSDLDPTDFRRSPYLSPEFNFGTVAAKRVSSSDTSNSDALRLECISSVSYIINSKAKSYRITFQMPC